MKTIILGISGRKQSGKTSTYEYIRRNAHRSCEVRDFSFAGPLKEFCVKFLGLAREQVYGTDAEKNSPVEHLLWENFPVPECRRVYKQPPYQHYVDSLRVGPMTGREAMQYWGTDVLRAAYSDVHAKAAIKLIDAAVDEYRGRDDIPETFIAVLPDMRFPNEVAAIKDAGGYTLRLTRNSFPDDSHPSETALDPENYSWDNFDLVYDNSEQSLTDQLKGLTPWLKKIGILS